MSDLAHPEGIERRHIHEAGGTRLHRLPIGLIGLGLLLVASIAGVFGREAPRSASGEVASLTVDAPASIRNGEFYEMVVTVDANQAIGDLVLSVGEDVWRDVTVNTFIPAPTEEAFADGEFTFTFGPLEAGERLVVKVDCQVNPDHAPSANRGRIVVADGEDELAEVDYVMEVLP